MKKKGWLKKNYSLCWRFLKETKKYILSATVIFFLFFLIGLFLPIFFREQVLEMIKELIEIFLGKTLLEGIVLIFFNNLQASFFALILGLGFGIFPLAIAIINGYVLGFVSREAINLGGPLTLWRILPHGVFELPAVLFAMGIGLRLGTSILSKERKTKKELKDALIFFLLVITPLLLIASIVEGCLIYLIR